MAGMDAAPLTTNKITIEIKSKNKNGEIVEHIRINPDGSEEKII